MDQQAISATAADSVGQNDPAARIGRRPGRFGAYLTRTALALLIVFHVLCAMRGMNYGRHWDEWYFQMVIKQNVQSLALIPSGYIYGSTYFLPGWLALVSMDGTDCKKVAATLYEIPSRPFAPEKLPDVVKSQKKLTDVIDSEDYKLQSRRIFILLSALLMVWIYLLVRKICQSESAGLFAAMTIAFSWEINYQSRHIAVDNTFMQYAVLVVCLLAHGYLRKDEAPRRRMLYWAALVAGVAVSTKFVAAYLAVPCLAAVFIYTPGMPMKKRLPILGAVIGFFVAFAIISNPGFILDPIRLVNDWRCCIHEYKAVGNITPAYTSNRLEHMGRALLYLGGVAQSPYLIIAFILTGFALWGVWRMFHKDPRLTILLLSYPVFFFYFITGPRLLIVRNLISLIPFVGIFTAVGLHDAALCCRQSKFAWRALGVFLVCWLLLNGYWMVKTARTVNPGNNLPLYLTQAREYVERHPRDTFYISKKIRQEMVENKVAPSKSNNVVDSLEAKPKYVVLHLLEHDPWHWPGNRIGLFEATFSSFEVNYDYYPLWNGWNVWNRIVVITIDKANEMNLVADKI